MRSSSFLLSVLNLRMGCDFLSSVPTCCVGSLAIRVLIWDCSTATEVVKKSAGFRAKHPARAGRRRGGAKRRRTMGGGRKAMGREAGSNATRGQTRPRSSATRDASPRGGRTRQRGRGRSQYEGHTARWTQSGSRKEDAAKEHEGERGRRTDRSAHARDEMATAMGRRGTARKTPSLFVEPGLTESPIPFGGF